MYHVVNLTNCSNIEFSASLRNIDIVCNYLEQFLRRKDLGRLAFDMILGAREVLNNAVVHGSQNDISKIVHFSVCLKKQSLLLQVTDGGPGFDFESASVDCKTSSPCGRGIFILDHYFDYVSFKQPGNSVELKKNIDCYKNVGEMCMTEIIKEGDLATVILDCDLVSSSIENLKNEFKQILKSGASQLKLDFKNVNYIDSMGLGLLVATHNSLQKNNSRLELTNLSTDILKLVKQMRLDMHFEIT